MDTQTKASFLAFASVFVHICQTGIAAGATMATALIPLSVIFPDEAHGLIRQHFGEAVSTFPVGAVAGLLAMVCLIMMLCWFFLRSLQQILNSAKLGEPYTLKNANRLTVMAWLMLAIQALKYPAASLGLIVETAFKGPMSEVEVSGTLPSLLLVGGVIILANFFRRSAANHHDLEGAV